MVIILFTCRDVFGLKFVDKCLWFVVNSLLSMSLLHGFVNVAMLIAGFDLSLHD